MNDWIEGLRELTLQSVIFRLALAIALGGMLGLERQRERRRAAGFRTYMLVCMGAALAMMFGQYEAAMFSGRWADAANAYGLKADICRMGAQVISGIGFLGAGIILVTKRQELKGLTTAAGLWASSCMGLAIGAGFIEGAIAGYLVIMFCNRALKPFEDRLKDQLRSMNFYIEFDSIASIGPILRLLREHSEKVYEVDLEREPGEGKHPNAVVLLRLKEGHSHSRTLAVLSELDGVRLVHEI